jgi:5-methylcytosine-specific restriction endonuclease McrA
MKWLILVLSFQVFAEKESTHPLLYPMEESRYCGTPARDAAGRIKRSKAVISAFRTEHPCPATGLTAGACTGWAIDHIIPLACGGCDSVSNMQWLPDTIKSSADADNKDRWERKAYCSPFVVVK